jgi:hypothetical protein
LPGKFRQVQKEDFSILCRRYQGTIQSLVRRTIHFQYSKRRQIERENGFFLERLRNIAICHALGQCADDSSLADSPLSH